MKNKQQIIFYFFMMLSLILSYSALHILNTLKPYSDNIYLNIPNQNMTKNELDKILSNNRKMDKPLDLLFIANQDETVSNPKLYKEAKSSLVVLVGEKRLFSNENLRLDSDDLEGCLLSETLVLKLFGSKEVKDKKVMIKGQKFIVRGVLSDRIKEDLVILNFSRKISFIPDTLIIKKSNLNISDTVIMNTLKVSYGIVGDALPFKILAILFRILIFLPLFLGSLIIYKICDRRLIGQFLGNGVRVSFLLFFLLIWLLILIKTIKLPMDFIPNTSWSDFSFFEKLYRNQDQSIKNFIKIRKGYLEMTYVYQIGKIIVLVIFSVFALYLSKFTSQRLKDLL